MHNVITVCYLVINAKLSHEYWLVLLSWLEQNFWHSLFSRSIFSTFTTQECPFLLVSRILIQAEGGCSVFPCGLSGGEGCSDALWEVSSSVQPPPSP